MSQYNCPIHVIVKVHV